MLDTAEALERCSALVDLVLAQGADSADAVVSGDISQSVSVRLGALEDVERSENWHIGLRAFVGRRSASIQATDFDDAALCELAQRAVAMARSAPEDVYAGLAPDELLASGPFDDFDLADPGEPAPEALRKLAEATEEAARSVNGVTNSEGGSASVGRSVMALVTSHGFAGSFAGTSHALSASVIAGEGAGMQRDHAWRQARYASDLPAPGEVGRLAGERAVARLKPGRLKSGKMPVVFDSRVSGTLLGHLIGAMSGASAARRSTFLLDRLDEPLCDTAIRIVERPHLARGLRSRPFDGEGLPTVDRDLVANGRIFGWLANSAAARQLDIAPTGHASRAAGGPPGISVSNVQLAAGAVSRAELIADIADGVYVTELFGHGVNAVTGDYSRGASGFRIVDGEIAGPVSEFTVAGNLVEMFAALTPADDLEIHRGIDAPTVRVDGMTVAGE